MKTTIFTSIVGKRDVLRNDQFNDHAAEFLAFTDQQFSTDEWLLRPAFDRFKSDRRNSRAPKILPHQFLETKYSVWMDGNVAIRTPVAALIEDLLAGADIAVFRHPKRDCCFAEAEECLSQHLDSESTILSQIDYYRRKKFPVGYGLADCAMIIRKHSPTVETFNNIWWGQYCRFSARDQISFPFAVHGSGIKLNWIDGKLRNSPYFDILRHTPSPEIPR